jgi:hypothetical protein
MMIEAVRTAETSIKVHVTRCHSAVRASNLIQPDIEPHPAAAESSPNLTLHLFENLNLCLRFLRDFFPSGILVKILSQFLISRIHNICPALLTSIYLIILIVVCEEHKL